jgi:hypothetical protein
MLQTGLETNVFGNHYVTIAKSDTRTPAFASDPLKNLSSTDDRESNSANSAKDAALPSTLHSGIYSSAVGSGTTIHVEPEIVEIEGPSPVLTQISEQESNFIRSPSPHGVRPEKSLYFSSLLQYVCLLSRFAYSEHSDPISSLCSLVP